ncbi:MAG: hypothetical protein EBR02_05250 [Alphaproteobacteria bacterium]|nr:hypothetical protein [Alphaproteobacteria bacterium]
MSTHGAITLLPNARKGFKALRMRYIRLLSFLLTSLFLGGIACAQTQPAIDAEGLQMLQAVQKTMMGDYKGAESEYSRVISINPQKVEAYLQRGVVRRELGNISGSQADGKAASNLATASIQKNPQDAEAYHQRGMAARLLGNYPQAKQDLEMSLSLGGNPDWKNDVRDTALEEKASKGIRLQ